MLVKRYRHRRRVYLNDLSFYYDYRGMSDYQLDQLYRSLNSGSAHSSEAVRCQDREFSDLFAGASR